jgi:hypothetical protein
MRNTMLWKPFMVLLKGVWEEEFMFKQHCMEHGAVGVFGFMIMVSDSCRGWSS